MLKIPYSILKIPYVYFEYLENTVFGNRRRANAARSRVRRAQRHLLTGSRDAARHLRGDLGAGRRRAQTLLLRGRLPAQTPFLHGPWPAQGPFRQPLRLRIFLRRMPARRVAPRENVSVNGQHGTAVEWILRFVSTILALNTPSLST